MPLVIVDVAPSGELSGLDALPQALGRLPRSAPVIAMLHGYGYDPGRAAVSPHASLFAARGQDRDRITWPARLGLGSGPGEPLLLAIGWPARGTIWRAWGAGGRAARPVAGLLSRLRRHGRTTHLVAHSLGARLCLEAVALAPAGSVGRVVLMAGAAHRAAAFAALAAPAGGQAEFINVTSRENDLYDAAVEALTGFADRTIGEGIGRPAPNWLDLQIDAAATRAGLGALGYPVAAPAGRVCHRSCYARPGLFALYRDLLAEPRRLPLALLRAHLPEAGEPRWSRLLSRIGERADGGGRALPL